MVDDDAATGANGQVEDTDEAGAGPSADTGEVDGFADVEVRCQTRASICVLRGLPLPRKFSAYIVTSAHRHTVSWWHAHKAMAPFGVVCQSPSCPAVICTQHESGRPTALHSSARSSDRALARSSRSRMRSCRVRRARQRPQPRRSTPARLPQQRPTMLLPPTLLSTTTTTTTSSILRVSRKTLATTRLMEMMTMASCNCWPSTQ